MNHQETFNTVLAHLLKQGKPAIYHGDCRYRTDDGLKCAVGCLIPDDRYSPDMEGEVANELAIMAAVGATEDDVLLLGEMQDVHDEYGPEHGDWRDYILSRFGKIARNFNLTMPENV